MSYEASPETKTTITSQEVAAKQQALAGELADLYKQGSEWRDPEKSVEIALRNPLAYMHDVGIKQETDESGELGDLQVTKKLDGFNDKWQQYFTDTNVLVALVATEGVEKHRWDKDTPPPVKLQNLVSTGDVNPMFRELIADNILEASELFAESVVKEPGNISSYSRTIDRMQAVVDVHRGFKRPISHDTSRAIGRSSIAS